MIYRSDYEEHLADAETISNALKTLVPREGDIIRQRFGLIDGEPRTLAEIAAIFGICQERVNQIQAKAIRRLRHPLRVKLLLGEPIMLCPGCGDLICKEKKPKKEGIEKEEKKKKKEILRLFSYNCKIVTEAIKIKKEK